MTAAPSQDRLLTLDEFAALPEDNSRRYELEHGILVLSPRPAKAHQRVIKRLALILDEQLPPQWEAFTELEVVVVGQNPGTVRVPDVVVAPPDDDGTQDAADIVIAVEVVSPGSRRKDGSAACSARSAVPFRPTRHLMSRSVLTTSPGRSASTASTAWRRCPDTDRATPPTVTSTGPRSRTCT
jgi:hypothetical protein